MIVLRERPDGGFERLSGNPVLDSLDKKERAPLKTLLSPTWSTEHRQRYGVHIAVPFVVPPGMHPVSGPYYEKHGDLVFECYDVEPMKQRTMPPSELETLAHLQAANATVIGVTLLGMGYPVLFQGDSLAIGCEKHKLQEWAAFTDADIAKMDAKSARRFWSKHRDFLLTIAHHLEGQ